MNETRTTVSQEDLLAFVDGQLDPARRDAVNAFLAANPDRAAEVADWQRQNEAMSALFGHVDKEPVPARLSPAALHRRIRSRHMALWRMAAAALVVFTLGIGAGWMVRGPGSPELSGDDRLIAAAVDAHQLFVIQKRHPVEVVAAEKAHLSTWLSNSLDRQIGMPDLTKAGLDLLGGRLLPSGASAAAQVMYETASGDRVTLYITPRAPSDAQDSRYERIGRLGALYWASPAITCTIVGDLPRADMEAIANEVFAALSAGSDDYRLS